MSGERRMPARWRWANGGHEERELWRGRTRLAVIWWTSKGWAWMLDGENVARDIEDELGKAEQAAKAALP